jgi:NADH dehydrogenase
MNVVVVGGSGFVGRHVVEACRQHGHHVTVLARGTRSLPPGVATVCADVAHEPLPLERLAGCEAIVNLAGIKREEGEQTFEAVHLEATKHLLEAARALRVRHFVHVSVVCSRPDPNLAYHDTKWRAEELVRASGLPFTLLKPGVIYGPGDDMITHLVKMIRFAPFFPVVGRGEALLQPVDVRDVADAVTASLALPEGRGRTYEIVGPDRFPLRGVVHTVAESLGLRLWVVPTPVGFQRASVRVMNALTATPLSTPAQLQMLVDGLIGDPEPARRELGLDPRPFTTESVRGLAESVPPLFGFSLRLVEGRAHAEWLSRYGPALPRAMALAALGLVLPGVLSLLIGNVWYRMAACALALLPVALFGVDLDWRRLLRPSWRALAQGGAAALVLYFAGRLATAGLLLVPAFAQQAASIYAWRGAVAPTLVLPLLLLIILGEEIVWRNGVTLPLAARLGPGAGVLVAALAFAVAHVAIGLPLLLVAALGAGAFWSALVVKTRSAWPALVCHVLWDLTVLFWLPYVRA